MSISLEAYLSQHASDAAPGELTPQIEANARELLARVGRLLAAFGLASGDGAEARGLRSGWRPAAVNARTPGAARHSRHMSGQAVDIDDDDNTLDAWLTDALLETYDLAREHPDATWSWCHLQSVLPPSGHRTFYP